MTDLYLRFDDEAAAKAALYRAGTGLDAHQQLQRRGEEPPEPAPIPEFVPKYRNIDTIGVISKVDYPVIGEDENGDPIYGEPVTISTVPGWHVNVRVMPDEDASGLEQYATTPATPVRVWA